MSAVPATNKMRLSSLLFLAPAAALSLALVPDDWPLIPIFLLSFLRTIALIVGFICLIATGRLDRWSKSRAWLVILTTVVVLVATFIVLSWQMMKQDYLPPLWGWTYIVLARALPIGLMASAFLPSKKVFVGCAALTIVAGVVFFSQEEKLGAAYAVQKQAAFQAERIASDAAEKAALERRLAELAAVPADAGPEPLLPFLDQNEKEAVQAQAVARLDAMPNAAEKLVAMLDGKRRLDAMVALTLGTTSKFPISDEITQRIWIVAGSTAREMIPTMGEVKVVTPEVVKLCRSLGWLSTQRTAALEVRGEHRAELVALRDWLRIIQFKVSLWCGGGPSMVDSILAAP